VPGGTAAGGPVNERLPYLPLPVSTSLRRREGDPRPCRAPAGTRRGWIAVA